ncbi:MAG: HAMP domain-containing protein [Leptospiraceae bacterium]|nr:HAMP domain-containing protein [Leptospiraceae bacterium]
MIRILFMVLDSMMIRNFKKVFDYKLKFLLTQLNDPKIEAEAPKWSIQVKLMVVISAIFGVTLSIIIILATFFFKREIDLRIRENSIDLVNTIGEKIKSDVQSILDKSLQLVKTLNDSKVSAADKNSWMEHFFANDRDFLFLGLYKKENETLVPIKTIYNQLEMDEFNMTKESFEDLIQAKRSSFMESFYGMSILHNMSQSASHPIFAISLPSSEETEINTILVVIVKLERIISVFKERGITTVFMVNHKGIVIAHPDSSITLSGSNFMDTNTVQSAFTSKVNNGQFDYIEKESGKRYLVSYRKLGFANSGILATIPEDKAFEAVYMIQNRNIFIMVISLCVALIVVYLFAKTISLPILALLAATLEITKGNFRVDIKPQSKDEVGLLTKHFVSMGLGLEEREKVKNILGSMIDPTVVEEAMKDLQVLKRGKEQEITAFFSDVASFSTISEQLSSVDLAGLLNEYLSAMTIILKKHDGVLDKYIGDAIVGIFNAPVDVEEHCKKAARASLEMIRKLQELREYWKSKNMYSKEAQSMDIRIGLNTGLAKVGFMGTDALASYTMMGDTVNLAARLEAAGKDYGVNILISESVKYNISNEMFTRLLDLVRVKGKNEPVKVYELICSKNEVTQSVLRATDLYDAGMVYYLSRNWDRAIDKFEESQKTKGKVDKAAVMLIARCQTYRQSPPPQNWDGVFTRTTK